MTVEVKQVHGVEVTLRNEEEGGPRVKSGLGHSKKQ